MFCMLLIKPFILTYFLENRIFWPNGPGLKYSDWTLVPQICFCSWKLVVTIQKASVPPFHNICSIIHCNEIYESVYKTLIMSRFYRAIFQTVKVLGSLSNYDKLSLFGIVFFFILSATSCSLSSTPRFSFFRQKKTLHWTAWGTFTRVK